MVTKEAAGFCPAASFGIVFYGADDGLLLIPDDARL